MQKAPSLTVTSLIHFELIFIHAEREGPSSVFQVTVQFFPALFVHRLSFLQLLSLTFALKFRSMKFHEFIAEFSFPFHNHVCVCVRGVCVRIDFCVLCHVNQPCCFYYFHLEVFEVRYCELSKIILFCSRLFWLFRVFCASI